MATTKAKKKTMTKSTKATKAAPAKNVLVRDVMHKGVESIDSSTTVGNAAQLMNAKSLHMLVVIDFDCALGGVLSQIDIVAAKLMTADERKFLNMSVGELMTNRVLTVPPDMSLREAAAIITKHRIHRVVVANNDDLCNPVGVLSLTDIMSHLDEV
jgi:CBS domain-containing protein